jgi:DNA invertase Pin-like site-specific DNA recombinase
VKTAFAYLRVSGKGQVEGDGFTRQLEAVKKYASNHDIKIAKVFREEGVSGKKDLENRPALLEMMTALHSNGTRMVLIEKLDRLARDLMIQETIIGDMRKSGFEIISAAEPDLCSDDPSRKLMRQVFGAIAEYGKAMLVLKLRGARQRKRAKDGVCEGRKAYGDRPGEQQVIDRAKELRAGGMTWDNAARQLNAEGLTTRYGGEWFGSTLLKILKRAAYPGQNGVPGFRRE